MIELIPTSFIFFLMAGLLVLFPHGVMRGALLLIHLYWQFFTFGILGLVISGHMSFLVLIWS